MKLYTSPNLVTLYVTSENENREGITFVLRCYHSITRVGFIPHARTNREQVSMYIYIYLGTCIYTCVDSVSNLASFLLH